MVGFLCRTDPGSRGRIASYEISEKGLPVKSLPPGRGIISLHLHWG